MYNAAEIFFVQSAVFCYWFVGHCRSKPHEPKVYFLSVCDSETLAGFQTSRICKLGELARQKEK